MLAAFINLGIVCAHKATIKKSELTLSVLPISKNTSICNMKKKQLKLGTMRKNKRVGKKGWKFHGKPHIKKAIEQCEQESLKTENE